MSRQRCVAIRQRSLDTEPVDEFRGGIHQQGSTCHEGADAMGGAVGYGHFEVADGIAVA